MHRYITCASISSYLFKLLLYQVIFSAETNQLLILVEGRSIRSDKFGRIRVSVPSGNYFQLAVSERNSIQSRSTQFQSTFRALSEHFQSTFRALSDNRGKFQCGNTSAQTNERFVSFQHRKFNITIMVMNRLINRLNSKTAPLR